MDFNLLIIPANKLYKEISNKKLVNITMINGTRIQNPIPKISLISTA